ncbi:hypothetical protein V0R50_21170 [Pseudomonas sp. 148P]|uniref:HK97 gp10 family phage protein n=1 Tax=Pseudomonas ulcerans TaxID=3115852 RepID=A0ABU7HW51_9PSED|nr:MULTISPECIES: hypothetical protein [unclassified Pseudomonas]MEE1922900.1 hypothetical protein [Pseudomonas sp. 147P]MEE1935750.1 hypothetical protein [Pseudomonas sp. 148P]
MANSVSIDGYLHVEGFDQFERDVFNKRKIRAGMRKIGQLITGRAQMNLALGGGRDGYPINRTGATTDSIGFKLSRSGFLVRVAPSKSASMKAFYPAYLHYGVRRKTGPGWRITPRDNYMTDALVDSRDEVQRILQQAFAAALLN